MIIFLIENVCSKALSLKKILCFRLTCAYNSLRSQSAPLPTTEAHAKMQASPISLGHKVLCWECRKKPAQVQGERTGDEGGRTFHAEFGVLVRNRLVLSMQSADLCHIQN